MKKLILYPLAFTGSIMLFTSLCWLLTAFFSIVFDTTIAEAACSPIVLVYVGATIGALYTAVCACEYISNMPDSPNEL